MNTSTSVGQKRSRQSDISDSLPNKKVRGETLEERIKFLRDNGLFVYYTPKRTGVYAKKMPYKYGAKYPRKSKTYSRYERSFRAAQRWKAAASQAYPRGSTESKQLYGNTWKEATPMQKSLRTAVRYRGPGAYSYRDAIKYGARGIGAAVGAARGFETGGLVGAAEGARSGWKAGKKASQYMGFGAYDDISENQLITGPTNQISVNTSHNSGDIVHTNTEFLQNVYVTGLPATTSGFSIQGFAINPGLADMFPFLSQIAQNFELYEFEGLMVEYRPTSGEYGNNGSNSIGKVVCCTNYDPEAADFLNSVQMENYDYANSAKPSERLVHGIETHPDQRAVKMLYTRTGESKKSKIFTDLGKFFIATEGIPFGANSDAPDEPVTALVGELWVTYKVRLSRSQLYGSLLGNNISSAYDILTMAGGGLDKSVSYGSNLPVTYTTPNSSSGLEMVLPQEIDGGIYLVTIGLQTGSSVNYNKTEMKVDNATFYPLVGAGVEQSTGADKFIVDTAYVNIDAQALARGVIYWRLESGGSPATFPNGQVNVSISQVPLAQWDEIVKLNPNGIIGPGVWQQLQTE